MKTVALSLAVLGSVASLWCLPASAEDQNGVRPGDEAMTCQQIGMELAPYAQQAGAAFQPLGETASQAIQTGEAQVARELPNAAALTAAATAASAASAAGAPGATSGVAAAEQAEQQRVLAEGLAEQKPIQQKLNSQAQSVLAQAPALQSNGRMMRLMQLAQAKNCQ